MILLGERTPPQLHSEEEGTLESSPGFQVLGGGIAAACHWWTRVLPACLIKGKEHPCYSEAISSGTTR